MVEDSVHDLLSQSALAAVETMFFDTPDDVSADPLRPSGGLVVANLTFCGTPPGWFRLAVSDPVARTLAANFTGCDDPGTLLPSQVAGVIEELANMICGAVLSRMESATAFDLGAPQSSHVGPEEPDPPIGAGSPCICRLEFAEGALLCSLCLKEPM